MKMPDGMDAVVRKRALMARMCDTFPGAGRFQGYPVARHGHGDTSEFDIRCRGVSECVQGRFGRAIDGDKGY